MIISISGASGFIGTELIRRFTDKGHIFNIIDRAAFALPDDEFLAKKIDGSDAVINLAGANISRRWTEAYKKELVDSRILTTRKIVNAIRNARTKPRLLISSSGIGIYDGTNTHTEESQHLAGDFMGRLCLVWEKEALTAMEYTRVVIFRQGIVLGSTGGAMKTMYPIFNYGLGGMIGTGEQGFSWIHIADLVNAFTYAMEHETPEGIINAVAPNPVTNKHFTKTFGKVLRQPTVMKVPYFALKMLYGEGAQALASGQTVLPEKLLKAGFEFRFPTIEKALMDLYKKL
jgi:uncharacterized protein